MRILLSVLLILLAPVTFGVQLKPLTAECLNRAAKSYSFHPDILLAILWVEGGSVGKNSRANKNGTYDIGPFQLNSMHRKTINDLGFTEEEVRNDGCVNVTIAAWHLRKILPPEKEAEIHDEDSYLSALANYHSATPEYNKIYAGKLKKAFEHFYDEDAEE